MPSPSPFAQDWRDCLAAHYTYIVRSEDVRTEHTLNDVLRDVGFSEQAMAEIKVRATMHINDLPDGFVPDLDALKLLLPDDIEESEDAVFAIAVPDMPEADVFDDVLESEADNVPEAPPPATEPRGPSQLSFF